MSGARVRAHALGFLEIVDKPSAAELREHYSQRYFQEQRGNYRSAYSCAERRYLEAKIRQKAACAQRFRDSGAGRMLDVGCGEGFALAHFRNAGWQVEGLDFSAAGVQAMNPQCLAYLFVGDLFELIGQRLDGGQRYDLAWMTNVLEHVCDPPKLLEDLRGLLAPGGVLVVTVPNDFSLLQRHLCATGHVDHEFWVAPPEHLAYFDFTSLSALANATGWECCEILADFPIDWFLLHPASNYVRQRSAGPAAHQARIEIENLLDTQDVNEVNRFYSQMARVGFGRQITAFLRESRA